MNVNTWRIVSTTVMTLQAKTALFSKFLFKLAEIQAWNKLKSNIFYDII